MRNLGNKLTAVVVAGVFAGGLAGCGVENTGEVEHSPETNQELAEIIQPKLNDLGAHALKLAKRYPENVSEHYNLEDNTIRVVADSEVDDPNIGLSLNEKISHFAVRFSVIHGTKDLNPNKVVEVFVYQEEETTGGGANSRSLMIAAPYVNSKPDNSESYLVEYSQFMEPIDAKDIDADKAISLSTDNKWEFISDDFSNNNATATTTARYILRDRSLDTDFNIMSQAAGPLNVK